MRIVRLLPLLAVMSVLLPACKNDSSTSTEPAQGEIAVSGVVKDAQNGTILQGVTVGWSLDGSSAADQQQTDAQGKFLIKAQVDSIGTVVIELSRTGYRDTSVTIHGVENNTYNVTVLMTSVQGVVSGGGTGLPQSITFINVTQPEISVAGVGGKETALLDWEVRDSVGNPVDAYHPAVLTFSIANGPGGGEYVSPSTVTTNASGQVRVAFMAGTRSGVAQVVASTIVGSRTVSSAPIRVVIDGGYPDQAHFTLGTEKFNFPTLGVMNNRLGLSVLVGDKYSNPATPSAVYFYTMAGVIQGTFANAVTTKDGQGKVDLISGNPQPLGAWADPVAGDGYHRVRARTVGENGVTVSDSLLLLWSGGAIVSNITPTTFSIANAGSVNIQFTVSDILGHPLAQGTKISAVATIPPPPEDGVQQNKVFLIFGNQGSVELPDVIYPGPGRTNFTMTLQDGSWGIVDTSGTPVTVTITVSGPNAVNPVTSTVHGVVH